jgi:hypothetical protein
MTMNDELFRGLVSLCGLVAFCVLAVAGFFAR